MSYNDELWKKSEIIDRYPTNYEIIDEFGDEEKRRYIYVIKLNVN